MSQIARVIPINSEELSDEFSRMVQGLEEAGSIRVNQKVYDKRRTGQDITVLSLGEAFFKIPMFDFGKIDFSKGCHYSDTMGLPGLREKISKYYSERYSTPSDPSNILISAGSKIILQMIGAALVNPGEEVLMHEPYWVSYPEQAKIYGGVPKTIPYWVKATDFGKYFTHRTRLVILNNPNNPAGSLYSKEALTHIHHLCKENGAYLVVDEAYSDFTLGNEFFSAGRLDPEYRNVAVVNSLSKNLGMSGWRLGYMISNPRLIYQMYKLNQHLITCAPTVLQLYLEQYFEQILEVTLPQVSDIVQQREKVRRYMDSINLEYLGGASTFYFFVNIKKSGKTSMDFCDGLLEKHNIACVPGSAYGKSTDEFIRVGVGTEPVDRIIKALDVIRKSFN